MRILRLWILEKIVFILNVWIVLELERVSGTKRMFAVIASFLCNVSKRENSYDITGRV